MSHWLYTIPLRWCSIKFTLHRRKHDILNEFTYHQPWKHSVSDVLVSDNAVKKKRYNVRFHQYKLISVQLTLRFFLILRLEKEKLIYVDGNWHKSSLSPRESSLILSFVLNECIAILNFSHCAS